MNYDTESWYKLFVRESTEDRLLPVGNRALRDFLLRLAKSRTDPTILRETASPGEDLARALNAHASEIGTIVGYVASMLADGYLTHRKGRLWISRFVEAQGAMSPGAKRQKTYRKRQQAARDGNVTGDGNTSTHVTHASVTSNVTGDARVTSQPIRSDPIREEEIPLPPSEPRARPADPLAVSLGGLRPDVAALHRTWQRSTGLTGHRLRGGSTDFDAVTLAESLDLHGPEDCTTVAETCMRDRMVNGTADDAGQKHTAIRYIFGNEHAFARILKAARDARTVANPRAEADFDAAFEAEA